MTVVSQEKIDSAITVSTVYIIMATPLPFQHGGSHDFRSHPIAPAGIKVIIHDKPAVRASWAAHGAAGFYIGPALQHYRSFQVHVTATCTTRITDTVQWFPQSRRWLPENCRVCGFWHEETVWKPCGNHGPCP